MTLILPALKTSTFHNIRLIKITNKTTKVRVSDLLEDKFVKKLHQKIRKCVSIIALPLLNLWKGHFLCLCDLCDLFVLCEIESGNRPLKIRPCVLIRHYLRFIYLRLFEVFFSFAFLFLYSRSSGFRSNDYHLP